MAIIGIDLGTTNSLAAIWKDGKVQLIKNNLGSYLTPSAVSIDSDGEILVGEPAKDRLITHPNSSAASFKRFMGMRKNYMLGNKKYTPEELSSLVLRKIKIDAEAALGEPVTEAVISVPAYFNDNQRQATRVAAKMAGLKVDRIVNEPSAAALACRYKRMDEEQVFLVVDFGGGTLDVSVVNCFENIIEIAAIAGDNQLGGNDFDEVIFEEFCKKHNLHNLSLNQRAILMRKAEQCKRQLTETEEAEICYTYENEEKRMTFTNDLLTKSAASLLLRMQKVMEKAIKDSHLLPQDITDVLLVGGSSKMPVVRRFVSYLFKQPINCQEDSDYLIAKGIGVYTGIMQRSEEIQDVVLTDVCPFTLGVGIINPNGADKPTVMSVMIPRNSVLPISVNHYFTTVVDMQDYLNIEVYQGEAYHCKENVLLGKIMIEVPPAPKGEEYVNVTFTYDINGLLLVEVENRLGKRVKKVIIDKNTSLTEEEIEKKREELSNIKVIEAEKEENRSIMALAERLYMETDGELQKVIVNCINTFTDALASNSKIKVRKTREKVAMVLLQINMQINRNIFDTIDNIEYDSLDDDTDE